MPPPLGYPRGAAPRLQIRKGEIFGKTLTVEGENQKETHCPTARKLYRLQTDCEIPAFLHEAGFDDTQSALPHCDSGEVQYQVVAPRCQ